MFHVKQKKAELLIKRGLEELSLEADKERLEALAHYAWLIYWYNKRIRLCGYQTIDEIVNNLILDSLLFFQTGVSLKDQRVIDVGTGVGIPSLPLKIYFSDWLLDLIEPARKKAAFLWKVQQELKIKKVRVYAGKVEMLIKEETASYSLALTRAFGRTPLLLGLLAPVLGRGALIVLYQGERTSRELKSALEKNLLPGYELYRQERFFYSFLSHPRFLTILKKA